MLTVVFTICCLVSLQLSCSPVWARYDSDRILLRDLSAITLNQNSMTTGRRSSPVPQLKCVGGSAGCHAFVPQVVQCRNVGFDGYDVQWECKTDMDDSYRFGKIQVSCEGYDYPDDPYVLRGSCGLEYTIDYTDAGRSRNSNMYSSHDYGKNVWESDGGSGGSWFLFLVVVFAVVFLICKMSGANDDRSRNTQRPASEHRGPGNAPPPYGFKPEYSTGSNYVPPPTYDDATYSSSYSQTRQNATTSPVGGFWSGLGLGGLGGYLFGSRRNNYGYGYQNPRPYGWGYNGGGYGSSRGWGSSWGSPSTTYSRRSGPSSSSSTSRTTSGFGGTSRR